MPQEAHMGRIFILHRDACGAEPQRASTPAERQTQFCYDDSSLNPQAAQSGGVGQPTFGHEAEAHPTSPKPGTVAKATIALATQTHPARSWTAQRKLVPGPTLVQQS